MTIIQQHINDASQPILSDRRDNNQLTNWLCIFPVSASILTYKASTLSNTSRLSHAPAQSWEKSLRIQSAYNAEQFTYKKVNR